MLPVRSGTPFGGLVSSDSLSGLSIRSSVILSIGAVNTLIGIAGESEPRWIIPSEFRHPDAPQMIYSYIGVIDMLKTEDTRRFGVDTISAFVEQLFLRYLLVNPDSVKVIVLESMSCTLKFKQALAEVLFKRFKAPLIEFLPAQPFALVPLNITSAIVVDVGYYETIVLPVVSGVPLPHAMQTIAIGSRTIHSRILSLLKKNAPCLPAGFVLEEGVDSDSAAKPLKQGLDSLILDDLCRQLCFVSLRKNKETATSKRYVPYVDRFARQYRIDLEIRSRAADVLFDGEDEEVPNLPSLILSSLLALSIDLRIQMAHKILLIGGTSTMRGFSTRLIQELNHILANLENSASPKKYRPFSALKELFGHFELLESPNFYQPHLPWIGASIDTLVDAGTHLPNQIQNLEFMNGTVALPDWTSITSNQ